MCFAANVSLPPMPPWYLYSFAFVLGAIVGSFLNVCILRIPAEGVSIFYPRNSRCPHCETQIRWYDNIPILSYLFLRGQCRSCKTSISLQYPLVELVTAVMALAVVKRFGASLAALVLFVFICGLIVITFVDIAHWIIPDVISLPGIPLGILAAYAIGSPLPPWQEAVWGAALGGGFFLVLSLGYETLMKRPGLGMGDVKLLAMIGAFLGWRVLPAVVLLSASQGLVVALLLYLFGWREEAPEFDEDEEAQEAQSAAQTRGEEEAEGADDPERGEDAEEGEEEVGLRAVAIQFGPFLCLAAVEALFWGEQIALWWLRLMQLK